MIALICHDITRITKDLNYINSNHTNGQVTTSTSFPIIKRLTRACNFNLQVTHKSQQDQEIQNRQFNQMLANLTHDIKTPLTVSMGYVQLLLQKNSIQQRQDLLRIQNNLTSVNYYLQYLMDFNLIQEKSQNLKLTQFNLSEALQTELFDYYDELNNKNISAKINIDSNIIINSDEIMFKRIFQNLLGNILKYAYSEMTVTLKNNDGVIKITFLNLTKERIKNANQLLNRFYTADDSRNNHSIGLGLSIVQSLVTTLGGKINLSVENNQFTIQLIFKHLQEDSDSINN